MKLSYWERGTLESQRGVIVIGAGLVGLSAAIEVKASRPDLSVLVIDKALVGAAASSRNAGFACFGSVSEIYTDIETYGEEAVVNLVQKRRAGIQQISQRFGEKKVRYNKSGGYEVFRNDNEFNKWEERVGYINGLLNEKIFSINATPAPLSLHEKCIFNNAEGQLDTGLLYNAITKQALSNDIEILRGIEVLRVNEASKNLVIKLMDEELHLHYDRLIIASNALTKSFYPQLNVHAVRNQVFITEPIRDHGLRGCFHLDKGYVYFRDVGNRVLIGGARNLFPEEETSLFGLNSANVGYLYNLLMSNVLPNLPPEKLKIGLQWSGILCGGNDRMPIVEKVSDTLTIAVRLSGMGVAIGIDIGKDAATLSLK